MNITMLEALKMSHEKWSKCAEISEAQFQRFKHYNREIAGLTEKNCGLCRLYKDNSYSCHGCPLCDQKNYCCADEWRGAWDAFYSEDYLSYHKNAVALRDRLAKLVEEEKQNETDL